MIRQTGLSMEEMSQKGVLKNQDLVRHRLQLGVRARVGEIYNDQLDDIACKLDTFNVFEQQRAEIRKSKEARDP